MDGLENKSGGSLPKQILIKKIMTFQEEIAKTLLERQQKGEQIDYAGDRQYDSPGK